MLLQRAKHVCTHISRNTLPRSRLFSTPPPPSTPAEDQFHRLDLRVGKILSVAPHPSADVLYVETIDTGDKERTIVSGLKRFYAVEDLEDKLVVVVCNMKPAKLRGIRSEGMLLAASTTTLVQVLEPPSTSLPGDKVYAQGFPQGPIDTVLNPKRKVFEACQPHLATNGEGLATYKGVPLQTDKGFVRVKSILNGTVS
ncbi:hypothetical protein SpCBS45565_g07131 [Spizellomyces sp. 'palustris']|nr:hypothetical protein SpCBS45565_g07131 [Spizellomyces sp. 'palustris']